MRDIHFTIEASLDPESNQGTVRCAIVTPPRVRNRTLPRRLECLMLPLHHILVTHPGVKPGTFDFQSSVFSLHQWVVPTPRIKLGLIPSQGNVLSLHYASWNPHRGSNSDLRFRKPTWYPFHYGDFGGRRWIWTIDLGICNPLLCYWAIHPFWWLYQDSNMVQTIFSRLCFQLQHRVWWSIRDLNPTSWWMKPIPSVLTRPIYTSFVEIGGNDPPASSVPLMRSTIII